MVPSWLRIAACRISVFGTSACNENALNATSRRAALDATQSASKDLKLHDRIGSKQLCTPGSIRLSAKERNS